MLFTGIGYRHRSLYTESDLAFHLQSFLADFCCFGTFIMTLVPGYTVFISGNWDTTTFVSSYMMVGFFPTAFIF